MVQIMQLPDFFGAAERGIAAGRQDKEYKRTEANREEVESLAPQIMSGDLGATTRGMTIDSKRTGEFQDEHTRRLKQLRAAAKYMQSKLETGDPLEIQAAWSSGVRPFLGEIVKDKPIPEAWSDDMRGAMQQALAMTAFIDEDPKNPANRVQSKYTDDQGNVIALMADGSRKMTGDKAAPNIKILEQEGQVPTGYVTSGGKAGEAVQLGGGAPAAAAPPAATGVQAGTGDAATVVNIEGIDPARQEKMARTAAAMKASGFSDAEIDEFMRAQMSMPQQAGAPAPAGNNLQTSQVVTGGPVRTPTAGEKAGEVAAAQRDAQNERPALAPGYRYTADGNQEFIPGGPADPSVAGALATSKRVPSPIEKRDIQTRQTKYAQVKNIDRGLERIDKALKDLDKSMLGTGPLSQLGQRYTQAGKELEAAVGGIQNSFLALTRVPGIGSQSDLEARIAAMQYPSLDQYGENNQRTIQNLREFARDLKDAYDNAIATDAEYDLEATAAQSAPAAGKRRLKYNPATGKIE